MSDTLQKEVFARLDAIAAKLGIGAGELWKILVKQGHVEAYLNLCWFGFWILVSLGFALLARRIFKIDKEADSIGIVVAIVVASVMAMLTSVTFFDGSLTCFFNPEYWAYKHLLDGLK